MTVPLLDLIALLGFTAMWLGYGPAQRHFGRTTINAGLLEVRGLWMRAALMRDNRIADASLVGHVIHSATFFASTSLLAVGALIGVLTGLDRLQPALDEFTLGPKPSHELLLLKVLLPLAVLVHGLFKLTWALRQLNYTVALIGAMPIKAPPEPLRSQLARRVGGVLSSALGNFNDGIRSYYFALAGVLWLIGPWVLLAAGAALLALLAWRQIGSGVADEMRATLPLMRAAHGEFAAGEGGDKTGPA